MLYNVSVISVCIVFYDVFMLFYVVLLFLSGPATACPWRPDLRNRLGAAKCWCLSLLVNSKLAVPCWDLWWRCLEHVKFCWNIRFRMIQEKLRLRVEKWKSNGRTSLMHLSETWREQCFDLFRRLGLTRYRKSTETSALYMSYAQRSKFVHHFAMGPNMSRLSLDIGYLFRRYWYLHRPSNCALRTFRS